MKNSITLFVFIFLSVLLPAQSNIQLDSAFAINGILQTNICQSDALSAIALQPDGKIVGTGYSDLDGVTDLVVVRYLPDGYPDLDFGLDGVLSVKIGAWSNEGNAIALQPDGKIVVAGYLREEVYNDLKSILLRFTPEGQLDSTFGSGGLVVSDFGGEEGFRALKIQPDGKILAAGSVTQGSEPIFLVARYMPDGSPDSNFGANGYKTVTFSGGLEICLDMLLQPDGKIVVVGSSLRANGWPDIALARLTSGGAMDGTFGSGGKVITAIGTTLDAGFKVLLQPDDKILVAGITLNALLKAEMAICRYRPNGSLDPQFGTGGKVRIGVGNLFSTADAIALRPDNKILVAGTVMTDTANQDFVIRQFNPDGSVDSTFGNYGYVNTDVERAADGASDLMIQPDGKILVAGSGFSFFDGGFPDIVVMRYITDLVVGAIESPEPLSAPLLYPNPVTASFVTVRYTLIQDAAVDVEWYSTDGKLLSVDHRGYQNAGLQEENINLPLGLSTGYYVLNIRTDAGSNVPVRLQIHR